jgi:hypothetical protein
MKNRYPPMEELPAFTPSALGQIGPSVIVSALDSIAPPRELVTGQVRFVRGLRVFARERCDAS